MRIIFITAFSFTMLWAGWTNCYLDSDTTWICDVEIGIGRNDGVSRVYVADNAKYIYEYTYREDKWEKVAIGPAPYFLWDLVIGSGRNDGRIRLYGVGGSGDEYHIYEFTYSSQHWDIVEIGKVDGWCWKINIGPGRNDNLRRIYAPTSIRTYEFTYRQGIWNRTVISQRPGSSLIIGPGRSDGINRVYLGSGLGVWELTFFSNYWQEAIIDSSDWFPVSAMVIEPGRNDDTARLYVGLFNDGSRENILEYTYRNGSWDSLGITDEAIDSDDLVMGQVRNDSVMRLYFSRFQSSIGEMSYTSEGWSITSWPGDIGHGLRLEIGAGRNDGILRLYGYIGSYDIYEYSWVAPAEFIAPVQGDTWYSNKTYDIKWKWSSDVRNVDLWCSIDGGLSRSLIVKAAPNTGSYQWTVPDLWISSDKCLIILADNSNPQYNVNYSDTFTIIGINGIEGMVGDNSNLSLLNISPNPFNRATHICYKMAKTRAASLKIYDASGRLVRDFTKTQSQGPGASTLAWDGRNDSGVLLPSGIYFLELLVISENRVDRFSRKIILER